MCMLLEKLELPVRPRRRGAIALGLRLSAPKPNVGVPRAEVVVAGFLYVLTASLFLPLEQ